MPLRGPGGWGRATGRDPGAITGGSWLCTWLSATARPQPPKGQSFDGFGMPHSPGEVSVEIPVVRLDHGRWVAGPLPERAIEPRVVIQSGRVASWKDFASSAPGTARGGPST